jgi:hypothetical protein
MGEIIKKSVWDSLHPREQEEIVTAANKLTPDPTERMALDDIRARDTDNLMLTVYKNLREYRTDSFKYAMGFVGESIRVVMRKFGITVLDQVRASVHKGGNGFRSQEFMGKRLDIEMRKRGIKQEYRAPQLYLKNRPGDVWKSGQYFYKDNEIAYFISNPMQVRYNRNGIVIPGRSEFLVLTNVPAPGKGGA